MSLAQDKKEHVKSREHHPTTKPVHHPTTKPAHHSKQVADGYAYRHYTHRPYAREHAYRHEVDHETHHALDHRFDDQHDVEPVHYHEHAVHRAFDSPDAHSYNKADNIDSNYRAYAEHGDVTPYEYSHGIYQDHESRYPAYEH